MTRYTHSASVASGAAASSSTLITPSSTSRPPTTTPSRTRSYAAMSPRHAPYPSRLPSTRTPAQARRTLSAPPLKTFRMPPSLPASLGNIPREQLIPVPGGGLGHSASGRQKKSHAKRQPDGHIPRPRNAFILFRCDFVSQKMVPASVENDHRNISRIAGQIWKQMDEGQRAPWTAMALAEKEAHKEKYPGYRYAPSTAASVPETGKDSMEGGRQKSKEATVAPSRSSKEASPAHSTTKSPKAEVLTSPEAAIALVLPELHRPSSCPQPESNNDASSSSLWTTRPILTPRDKLHPLSARAELPDSGRFTHDSSYSTSAVVDEPLATTVFPLVSRSGDTIEKGTRVDLETMPNPRASDTYEASVSHVPSRAQQQLTDAQYYAHHGGEHDFHNTPAPLHIGNYTPAAYHHVDSPDTPHVYHGFTETQFGAPISPMVPPAHQAYFLGRQPESHGVGYIPNVAGEAAQFQGPSSYTPISTAGEGSSSVRKDEFGAANASGMYGFFSPVYDWPAENYDSSSWSG